MTDKTRDFEKEAANLMRDIAAVECGETTMAYANEVTARVISLLRCESVLRNLVQSHDIGLKSYGEFDEARAALKGTE